MESPGGSGGLKGLGLPRVRGRAKIQTQTDLPSKSKFMLSTEPHWQCIGIHGDILSTRGGTTAACALPNQDPVMGTLRLILRLPLESTEAPFFT